MAVTLGPNINALRANRQLSSASGNLFRSLTRLSSGSRINSAADDAAGLAIASQLRTGARIYSQAILNGNDGLSAFSIAEGALGQMKNVLLRLKELATQSASGSLGLTQRLSLDTEANQLTKEYNRIIGSSAFNGRNLLDGSFGRLSLQLGVGADNVLSSSFGSELSRNKANGAFTGRGSINQIGTLVEASSADFNGDGIRDIVANEAFGASSINVYLGSSSGTFNVSFTANSIASSLVAGDVNGDGKPDIMYYDTNWIVHFGDGAGGFGAGQNISGAVAGVNGVQLVDVTGDGKLDLIGYSGANTISVYKGDGSGNFSLASTFTAAGTISSYAIGDFNGDGRPDIVSEGTNTLAIHLGTGNGSFSFGGTIAAGANTRSVVTADFNHDGKLDLAVGLNGAVQIYNGNGNGTFKAPVSYSAAAGNNALALADLDNDGELDLIAVGTSAGSSLAYLRNNGDGTFAARVSIVSGLVGMDTPFVGDFDGDGVPDISLLAPGASLNWYKSQTEQTNNIQRFNLTTRDESLKALTLIDNAFARIQSALSAIGASSSRTQTALQNLMSLRDVTTEAASRISDIDVAKETAELTKNQILQQIGTAILAQSESSRSIVLQLLSTS